MKKRKIIKGYILPIWMLLIVILAFVFPFKIFIEDALSLEVMTEFGIEISIWRIIFEPVLGLLLFFNRGLYALQELTFVLIWILILFFIFSTIKFFKLNRSQKRNYVINQLIKIPIIIGLWLTLFALIIFIPMPNNKIVNNSKDYILVSTHAHTEYSHDGLITQNNMWEWQKNNGFDAFFITDHANHKKTHELMCNQRKGDFPITPLILTGEEYSASNHMSLLGLKNKFESGDLSDQAIIDSVHAYGGVIIINHWFDGQKKNLDYYRDLGVDGFEIENSGSDIYYDRELHHKMIDYCIANKLIMIGGLDFHGYGNACTLWNAMKIPGWHDLEPIEKEAAILKVLKNADQSKNKILMYKDRSYYKNENLLFTPVFTLINYFRTLNIYQVLSWFFWLIIFKLVAILYKKRQISSDKSMAFSGFASALFIIMMGIFYYLKIDGIIGYTKMYVEYSSLFFYIGFIFMAYMLIYIFFKIIKPKRIQNV